MSSEQPVTNVLPPTPDNHDIIAKQLREQRENRNMRFDLLHFADMCDRAKQAAQFCEKMLAEAEELGVSGTSDAVHGLEQFKRSAAYEDMIIMARAELARAGEALAELGLTTPDFQSLNRPEISRE